MGDWSASEGPIDRPPPCTLDAQPDSAGLVQGQISEAGHVLSELWLCMLLRPACGRSVYIVEGFRERESSAAITGFVAVSLT